MEETRTFMYTEDDQKFLLKMGGIGFVIVLESTVVILLIIGLVQNNRLQTILLVAYGLLVVAVLGFAAAPLFTRHRLTADTLYIRFGWDKAVVPRSIIIAAESVSEPLSGLQGMRARIDDSSERLIAALSEHGQILLKLDAKYTFSINGSRQPIKEILLNVDERDLFLDMLNIASRSPEAATADEPITLPHPPLPLSPSSTTVVLHLESVSRHFGAVRAVDDVTFSLAAGQIVGLLGMNGAGKTTALRMMAGLLKPHAGQIFMGTYDIWKEPLWAKQHIGYMADTVLLYERLTGREFLHFLGQMRRLPLANVTTRIDELLTLLQLDEWADRLTGTYSFGMQRKLALGGALLHQPQLLLLDEPLNGLDPRSARRIKTLFREIADAGTGILLSTHDLATAASLCDRIIILHGGRLISDISAHELHKVATTPDLETLFLDMTEESRA